MDTSLPDPMDVDTPAGTPAAPADSRQDTPDTEQGAAAPQAPLPLAESPSAYSSNESVFAEGARELALLEDVLSAFQRLNGHISQHGGRFGVNMDLNRRSDAVDIIYERIPEQLRFLRGAYELGGGAEERRMDVIAASNESALDVPSEDEDASVRRAEEVASDERNRESSGSAASGSPGGYLQIMKSLRL